MRAGAPPSRGLLGLLATLGTEEQTQAVLGTEGCSVLPCPHPAPPPPLGLKCCWEGEGRWDGAAAGNTGRLQEPSVLFLVP